MELFDDCGGPSRLDRDLSWFFFDLNRNDMLGRCPMAKSPVAVSLVQTGCQSRHWSFGFAPYSGSDAFAMRQVEGDEMCAVERLGGCCLD